MEELGIDWKILLGQLVNFAILLFLLKRFAYRPFIDLLEKRRRQIEEGVNKSQEAEKAMERISGLEQEAKNRGKEEARAVLKQAEDRAKEKSREVLSLAQAEKEKMLAEAKLLAVKEIEEAKKGNEERMIETALVAAGRFMEEHLDKEKDKELIEKIISELR